MFEENNKTMPLGLLGAIGVIGIVGLVLMFNNAQTTGLVYGGDARNGEQYPYLEGRNIGSYTDGEWGNEAQAWQTGVPYRTYARAPPSIPTEHSSCGPYERALGSTLARSQELRYGVKCRRTDIGFCCPIPEYSTGVAKEVKYSSYWN
ncbi:MAG: hypothetical protein HY363_04250 [Candidatus Aenigmarchaeota archaeon]|nr:hypothetical protein [Candidatus Aenigmarchaeota archaeon]